MNESKLKEIAQMVRKRSNPSVPRRAESMEFIQRESRWSWKAR